MYANIQYIEKTATINYETVSLEPVSQQLVNLTLPHSMWLEKKSSTVIAAVVSYGGNMFSGDRTYLRQYQLTDVPGKPGFWSTFWLVLRIIGYVLITIIVLFVYCICRCR